MTGVNESAVQTIASGDQRIDGILHSTFWSDGGITYAFPAAKGKYGSNYGFGESAGFVAASQLMRDTAVRNLDIDNGYAADDGFSVEGFTALHVTQGSATTATIRLAQTSADPHNYGTAWAYSPGTAATSGDVWFHTGNYDYSSPVPGNYAHHTLIHEMGHALGLAHGHEATGFGPVPIAYDTMEYSVMTYRSYEGDAPGSYSNESIGYAQSYMMLDIAALQHLYGANFTTNSGDTTYSWSPNSGETFVNGDSAFTPAGNRIFATIWDGGGEDTYDLSAYSSGLTLDLAPGEHSAFDSAQLARLGPGTYARGNIFNALLHEGDPRSLIENAIGGSGADTIHGNKADNTLMGGGGEDSLYGRLGNDVLNGQTGDDALRGGRGQDELFGKNGNDKLFGGQDDDRLRGGNGDDRLFGSKGDDDLNGGEGHDRIIAGEGKDLMNGGAGEDRFVFRTLEESQVGNDADLIRDFEQGLDVIDVSSCAVGSFVFNGNGGFLAGSACVTFSHQSGQTQVMVDVDGDLVADMQINLTGVNTLQESDFIL